MLPLKRNNGFSVLLTCRTIFPTAVNIINVLRPSCKVIDIFVLFEPNLQLDRDSYKCIKFHELRPVGAELILAGRRKDRHD